jgi:hypothetical protein
MNGKQSIAIHELLAERKQIALIWCIQDVLAVRPDLSAEQAWDVLQAAERRHDATIGINWDVLACHAWLLYGEAETRRAGEEQP